MTDENFPMNTQNKNQMNNIYDGASVVEKKGYPPQRPTRLDAGIVTDRIPMLPLLLNDLSQATQGTVELVEQLENRLDPISSPPLSTPESPNQKDPSCLPPALEMLRATLTRVIGINERLNSLMRRVEI